MNEPDVPALATPGLALEPLRTDHAPALFGLLRDPALYRHLDDGPPASVEALRAVYERLEAGRSPDGRQLWLNWIVRLRDGEPVGTVQATVVPAHRRAWVAYVLARSHWGRGHATQAVRAVMEHLAPHHALERFLATVELRNRRSIRVLARLGFRLATPDECEAHALSPSERLYVRPAAAGSPGRA